jgi:hypothetical protein
LGGTLGQENLVDLRLGDVIHPRDVLADALSNERNPQGVGITASADNFVQDSLGPSTGVGIDGLIGDEVGIEEA